MKGSACLAVVVALVVFQMANTQETTSTSCPWVECAPECFHDNRTVGCPTCKCPPTCQDVNCTKDEQCVLKEVYCIRAPCFPFPTCVSNNETTTTPCPRIECASECFYDNRSNGCPTCKCPRTCKDVNCTKDEKCVLDQIVCIWAPCFPIPTCVPKNETTTTPCPRVECAPECFYDNRSAGCPTCKCPKTCKDINCTEDEQCVLKQVYCITEPCFPIPTCFPKNETTTRSTVDVTPCAYEVLCMVGCERVLRPDGCPTCVCPKDCEHMHCPDGYECEMMAISCFAAPCPPSYPICVPIKTTTPCPVLKCAPECVPDIGPNGCSFCACPPTCEDIKCAKDEECVLKQIKQCIRAPCFPEPICVPRNGSCTGTPNTGRCGYSTYRWSYNASTNTCESFRYYGCTPSPNTFLSLKACEAKCRTSRTCDNYCGDDCYTFTRKNQRTRCICPNPCKDFNCTGGLVCKLREVICRKNPCNPRPYCTQNLCPTQPPCGKHCMYGLKTNENECQLCECCEEPKQY